ncbi:MAG TPA: sigma-70 family RNA polymerase sigma factor [Opitutus sp.]|nr:sigma-70 family RNA polymerase sigma factor [Opitutus sp.]
MDDDVELLARFARDRSEAAFTELVRRKAALVYSAALRQVDGDMLLAQEVSQSVFIDLARKAAELAQRPVLTSWLYTSTRFAALKARRSEQRRQRREQEAHAMHATDHAAPSAADWEQLRPLLDSALCNLAEHDRAPILMRYFENQPFGEMGRKLGIAEGSARLRAERAIEKLRLALVQRGITSTAAALALALSTRAVAAPPSGLAAALATGALAKSAAAGSGAGLVAKLYQAVSLNKVPSGFAAFATVGAGMASYEAGGDTQSKTFIAYAVCFGVGLVFTLISAVAGHVFGGHGEAGHDFHANHEFDSSHDPTQGHAEAGGNAADMPGFAPLSPTTIATFITAFGGFGMMMQQLDATRSPWVSAPLSALGAFAIAAAVFLFFRAIFQRTQASSEGHVSALIGESATVITPIAPGSVGEIAYIQTGTRYSAPARAGDGSTFVTGSVVRIARIVGTVFYVESP